MLGIDLPYYLAQMESINDKCSFPAGHFEEMIHWIQRDQKVQNYIYPILVGDGAGASFAYIVDAQAPVGTYAGLITLGWDTTLRFPKPVCSADAGPMTVADNANPGQFRLVASEEAAESLDAATVRARRTRHRTCRQSSQMDNAVRRTNPTMRSSPHSRN